MEKQNKIKKGDGFIDPSTLSNYPNLGLQPISWVSTTMKWVFKE